MAIPFIDLKTQQARIRDKIDAAMADVLDDGRYVNGPAVFAFEEQLATYGQAKKALGCANGTDALQLALMALGVGPGDAVFCPSFTFVATAEVMPLVGAVPVFVDIEPDTYNMDPASLERAIEAVKADGTLTPKAVIGVCLFGQAANYPALAEIARSHGLSIIADSAQGFGTTIDGCHPIDFVDITTTSFFPAKPLGCYGDGGAVLTNDDTLWDVMDSLHIHGKASQADMAAAKYDDDPRYLNMRVGMNSRLDTLQAVVLIEKLAIFEEEIAARNTIAARYNEALAPHVRQVPTVKPGYRSVWAQYVIEHEDRDGLQAHLREQGVPTAIYYPVPLHRQPAYKHHPQVPGGLPVSEAAAGRVLALPMHPYLDDADQDRIVAAIADYT